MTLCLMMKRKEVEARQREELIENNTRRINPSLISKNLSLTLFLNKEYFISHKTTSIFDDYIFDDKILGKGSFGIVHKVHEKNTGIVRAVKQVLNENIQNYDGFMNEVAALKTLDHPNIIKLFEVYEDKK